MTMFAIGIRRGSTCVVTAFSLASLTTSSKNAATVAASRSGPLLNHYQRRNGIGAPFGLSLTRQYQRASTTSASSGGTASITALKSAVATTSHEKLEQTLEITHPAYDVVAKDVVTEYGAYCTLYKHKKSGAQLLSVSNDDDNKVRHFCVNYCIILYH